MESRENITEEFKDWISNNNLYTNTHDKTNIYYSFDDIYEFVIKNNVQIHEIWEINQSCKPNFYKLYYK